MKLNLRKQTTRVSEPDIPVLVAPKFKRLLAFLIDSFVIFILLFLIFQNVFVPDIFPGGVKAYEKDAIALFQQVVEASQSNEETGPLQISENMQKASAFFAKLLFIGFSIYFALMELILDRSSLGKKIFGLKTVSKIEFGKANALTVVSRSIVKSFTMLSGLYFLLNCIPVFFGKYQQAGHDWIFRTIVVKSADEKESVSKLIQ